MSRSLQLYSASYKKFDNIISSSLLTRLGKAVQEIGDTQGMTLVESHGDLCLSNILACYDGNVRFIDPRGSDSIWLDEYYDMAKLSQSIMGGYDFIINDIKLKYVEVIFVWALTMLNVWHRTMRFKAENMFMRKILTLWFFKSQFEIDKGGLFPTTPT